MTDEEIAELVAENQRLRAQAEATEPSEAAPVIVEATEPPPVAEQVQVIEAQADAAAVVIAAEAEAQVAVIEATAEAEQPKQGDDGSDSGGLFMPEADHWYFKRWGKK